MFFIVRVLMKLKPSYLLTLYIALTIKDGILISVILIYQPTGLRGHCKGLIIEKTIIDGCHYQIKDMMPLLKIAGFLSLTSTFYISNVHY